MVGLRVTAGLALLLAATGPARAQISPGKLSRAHAALDGTTRCFKCHGGGSGRDAMNRDCLACHREIAWHVERGSGLHGTQPDRDCAGCHPEHAGVDFELIVWEEGAPEKFDHARTGWPLEGKHATRRCGDCHKTELQRGHVLELRERKNPSESWLGLERRCLACHEDPHRGALGADCTECHDQRAWKPAPGFDHARTEFPLTGKHADVACDKCHLVPGRIRSADREDRPVPVYKPLPHQECSGCHRDPHAGLLGPRCSDCHSTADFKRVDRKAFDHAKTRYPLKGRHASVDCAKCHDPVEAWGRHPEFGTCGSCHADAHAGRATLEGRPADCAACHDERSFERSTYTARRHASSAYPLAGKHAEVRCDRCHAKNPPGVARSTLGSSGVLLRMRHEACRDCHADAHADQLAARPDGGACESCHRVQGWKPSTYAAERHAETGLALEGRHREIECAACHAASRRGLPPLPGPDVLGPAKVALTPLPRECVACHLDPHQGRFGERGERRREAGCLDCHGWRAFRPSTVDAGKHREFAYPLEGGHRAVPCVLCHRALGAAPPEIELLALRGTPRELTFRDRHDRCETCHDESPHGAQFEGRKTCDACHSVAAFRPADRFDHERDSGFPLRGGHRDVPCARCHPARDDGRRIARVVYRPIPSECRDCHGRDVPVRRAAKRSPS